MSTDQIMNVVYLGLLLAAIGGSYLMANRRNLGKMAQQASIWALIFVGAVAAIGLWGDISRTVVPQQSVSGDNRIIVPQSPDGHYYLTLGINDTPVRFVVDTGATMMVLSQQDAARVGLEPDKLRYIGSANTANGVVRTAPVVLGLVTLGPLIDTDVRASVNEGQMDGSLLGMSYLDGFAHIQFSDGEMILTR